VEESVQQDLRVLRERLEFKELKERLVLMPFLQVQRDLRVYKELRAQLAV
jgi:hypothetical protein